MRRRLFSILSAVSLLVCLATAALWVHSQFASYWVGVRVGKLSLIGTNFRSYGGVDVRRLNSHWTSTGELRRFDFESYPAEARSNPLWFLPRYHHRTFAGQLEREIWDVRIPYWMILLASSVMPVIWFRATRQVRRAREGFCPACGYDLRATPDHCPECGRTPV